MQMYSVEWKYLNENNTELIQNLTGLLRHQGIIKLERQASLAEKLAMRCESTAINDTSKRTVVVPTNKYIDLMIPLLLDEKLICLVSHYLNAPARLQSWGISWNNHAEKSKAENGQLYHRDRDDFRSLRLYLYLSDVNEDNGPHFYLRSSHTWDLLTKKTNGQKPHDLIDDTEHIFMDDKMIFQLSPFEKEDEVCILGKQGFCWLEDGGGLHKGSIPKKGSSSRLLLSVTWGLYEGAQYENAGGREQIDMLKKYLSKTKIELTTIQRYLLGLQNNTSN